MWRSFFFAVGTMLIFIGLQCLVFEEFYVDQNSRIFAAAQKANRALEATAPHDNYGSENGQQPALVNQQRFSLPSSESYYGGPSRFQSSGFSNNETAYGGPPQFAQQSVPAAPASSRLNGVGEYGDDNQDDRPKLLQSLPVRDWMPWGFLAAGTIVTLYTNATGHSRYSGD